MAIAGCFGNMRTPLIATVVSCLGCLIGRVATAAPFEAVAAPGVVEITDPPEAVAVLDGAAVKAVGAMGLLLVGRRTDEANRLRGYVQTLLTKRRHRLVILDAPELAGDPDRLAEVCRQNALEAVVLIRYSTTADTVEAHAEVLDPTGFPLSRRFATPAGIIEDSPPGSMRGGPTSFSFRFRRDADRVRAQLADPDDPGAPRDDAAAPSSRTTRKVGRMSLRVLGSAAMGVGALWMTGAFVADLLASSLCGATSGITAPDKSCSDRGPSLTVPLLISGAGTAVFITSFFVLQDPRVPYPSRGDAGSAPTRGPSSLSLSLMPLPGDGGAMLLGGRF